MTFKFYYSLIVFTCLCLAPFSYSGQTLIAGYSHYPPFQYTNAEGQAAGLDIEILNAVLTNAGYQVQFKKMPWTRQLQVGIKNGELDILMQAKRTKEREAHAYFSENMYIGVNNAMFIRKQDIAKFEAIHQLQDLIASDITVAAVRGSIYSEQHQALLAKPEFTQQLVYVSKDEQSINMLSSGRVDAFLATDLSTLHLLHQHKLNDQIIIHMYLNKQDVLNQGSMYMFSKANMTQQQVDAINASIKKLSQSGAIDRILAQHGFESSQPLSPL